MLAPLPLPASSTKNATATMATAMSATWAPVSRSPNIGTATITMITGEIAPIRAALASDVSWNDAKPRVCATANSIPPGIAALSHRQLSGALASQATAPTTGTANQFRQNAIVNGDESTDRTNSGPHPHRKTTTATAR